MRKLFLLCALPAVAAALTAEVGTSLKQVRLYSSGVAQYEYRQTADGSVDLEFLFSPDQIDDVLKSIEVSDPQAKSITIAYQSEDTLRKTLESLKVDLSTNPSVIDIIEAGRGSQLVVYAPEKIEGKILGIDQSDRRESTSVILSLATAEGIRIIPFDKVSSFRFADPQKNTDLHRALDLLSESASQSRKKLAVHIESNAKRDIRLSYVMPAPVWKATYRLEMKKNTAFLQGWAIIDNSSDTDWKNIDLTLMTGRPVSFRQNLYEPYYVNRPTLPLNIAGIADAETFSSGYTLQKNKAPAPEMKMERGMRLYEAQDDMPFAGSDKKEGFEPQAMSAKKGSSEQFVFTAKDVSLERQKSMMIPLILADIPADRFSVFSAGTLSSARTSNPKLCIELQNNSQAKLPAGPISVSFGTEYAGDALLEFLPNDETRLIAFGDDLSVYGSQQEERSTTVDTVSINRGKMHIKSSRRYKTRYVIRNTDDTPRQVLIEHPIRTYAPLAKNTALKEKTDSVYRFVYTIPAHKTLEPVIEEVQHLEESLAITNISMNTILYYSTNDQIPQKVQDIFARLAKERDTLMQAKEALKNLHQQFKTLAAEQERTRKNLESVGMQTTAGKRFLNKLLEAEETLDALSEEIKNAEKTVEEYNKRYMLYIDNLNF